MKSDGDRLSPLEVLLLVLVTAGISTPYDLLKQVRIGVGTSSPALRRMEANGLLTVTPGPRNRMRFALTEEGDTQLMAALEKGPEYYYRPSGPDTFDNLRRVILLAWIDGRLSDAMKCIETAQRELQHLIARQSLQAAMLHSKIFPLHKYTGGTEQLRNDAELIGHVSRWTNAVFDISQARLQIEALQEIKAFVLDLPAPPNILPKSTKS